VLELRFVLVFQKAPTEFASASVPAQTVEMSRSGARGGQDDLAMRAVGLQVADIVGG
jgi:hypothetical protein